MEGKMISLDLNIPKDFLNEEVRSGYKVSNKMKEVWAVEIDLLDKLLQVCKRNSLQIYASDGTLLGAIRHNGFIPWDDDIDMIMMRDQYERLCEIASNEFQYPYFFQTEYTDLGSLRGHAQLRNSNTTGILESEENDYYNFNQGIFIDIFPLDVVIDDKKLFCRQRKTALMYKEWAIRISSLSVRYRKGKVKGIRGIIKHIFYIILKNIIIGFHIEEYLYRKFELTCQRYNQIQTEKLAPLSFQFDDGVLLKYKSDLKDMIEIPFEFIQIPVPKGYDRILRQRFGDYMVFKRENSYHGNVKFDVNKSYVEYVKR